MIKYFQLLRVKQYTKNLFIFLPLFFALKIFEGELLIKACISFAGFCLVASAVYIINDYRDRFEDAKHPTKKNRPFASGKISSARALLIMVSILFVGLLIEMYVGLNVFILATLYFFMNIAYSFGLKKIALVDVFIIALGFTMRVFVGGSATGVVIQPWIVVMTFLLALFLALAKRRDDIVVGEGEGKQMRKSMDGYNLKLLDSSMIIMASVIVVAYLSYTLSPDIEGKFKTTDLYYTVFFVLFGIMRYMQIAFVEKNSGSPSDILLKDRLIQTAILGWIALFGILIYF